MDYKSWGRVTNCGSGVVSLKSELELNFTLELKLWNDDSSRNSSGLDRRPSEFRPRAPSSAAARALASTWMISQERQKICFFRIQKVLPGWSGRWLYLLALSDISLKRLLAYKSRIGHPTRDFRFSVGAPERFEGRSHIGFGQRMVFV